jgi:hypothetical protein
MGVNTTLGHEHEHESPIVIDTRLRGATKNGKNSKTM